MNAYVSKQLNTLKLLVLATVTALLVSMAFLPKPTSAAAGTYALWSGECMVRSQYLISPSGTFTLWFQNDGNIVMYNRYGQPVWQTNTPDYLYRPYHATQYFCMQTDGNLVVYFENWSAIWQTGTNRYGGGNFLFMQDDGNLVVYRPNWTPVWWTGAH